MSHLREIVKPRCGCGAPATVQGFNDRNAPMGYFCRRCGRAWLRRQTSERKGDK